MPQVHEQLRQRALRGEYNREPEKLFEDLKSDLALLTSALAKAPALFVALRPPERGAGHVLDDTLLHSIIPPELGDVSVHSLEQVSKLQLLQLRHNVVSTSIAELIAEAKGKDKALIHTCAALRQLGLSLVCFNYPSIYRRALKAMSETGLPIESHMAKFLGFSPEQLGASLAARWGLRSEIIQTVLYGTSRLGKLRDERNIPDFSRICMIGETFARLSDPESFSHFYEEGDWLLKELDSALGAKSTELIRGCLEPKLSLMAALSPSVFTIESDAQVLIDKAQQYFTAHLMLENSALQSCPEETVGAVRPVYDLARPFAVSSDALNLLVTQVIPQLGFIRGCIYIFDRASQRIVPRLRIGNTSLSRYSVVSLKYGTELAAMLTQAMTAPQPIREKGVFLHDAEGSHLTWRLGDERNVGILHLELGPELIAKATRDCNVLFEVVRRALLDCLGLKPSSSMNEATNGSK